MTIRRGYKLRLHPSGAQRRMLEHWCGGARWTWNATLDWRETLYRRGHAKNISGQHWFAKLVTRWKRAGSHPWLEDVPADVLGNKLRIACAVRASSGETVQPKRIEHAKAVKIRAGQQPAPEREKHTRLHPPEPDRHDRQPHTTRADAKRKEQ